MNRETLERQERAVSAKLDDYWARYYHFASTAEGAEAWAAFVSGDLAAYLVAFRMAGCANILIVRSASAHLSAYPNNALLFTYIQEALKAPEIREVSIGLEPIQSGITSLDHFKFGMGFRAVPIGQRIEVAPWLRLVLRGPVLTAAQRLIEKRSADDFYSKGAGLLRWYREQPRIER